jgi:hypothetical protein
MRRGKYMQGLELSKRFYLNYGKPAIEKEFADVVDRIAVGLVGQGSECFGFDDDISSDHDFEPGFCIWLTQDDYDSFAFRLERLYSKLPKEFEGYKRLTVSPVGGNRHGVMVIDDFYKSFLGSPDLPISLEQWLYIPHEALATACNGEVFVDNLGKFSSIRNTLLLGYPQDVKLKKLAAHLVMMLQTGLYNYNRCIERSENGAAQLCIFEFVKHTISAIYLLNNEYEPFYKWAYRKMRGLKVLSSLESSLVGLTELGNSELEAQAKSESIEEICKLLVDELKKQGLSTADGYDLEKHSMYVQNKIGDPSLRNMHIMEGI